MPEKTAIELGSVQKTLLLPLWGRALETRKQRPLMVDKLAAEIIDKIDFDFTVIANNMSEITRLAWIARCLHIDRTIGQFLTHHPKASIINIGCGLDTTFNRVDNGMRLWYDLDLQDVIALRKKLLKETERSRCIACSFLEDGWLSEVTNDQGVMFIAAGVFYYFTEDEIKGFFRKVADKFPQSELIFDIASVLGVRVANKKVIEAGGMDQQAVLKWGIDSARKIQDWDGRIMVVDEYPMFKNMKKNLSFRNAYGTFWSDRLKIMSMAHLKIM
jgi:O-methyltransferase involved in polyketide biosynthesis